jgi:hypothetical protein
MAAFVQPATMSVRNANTEPDIEGSRSVLLGAGVQAAVSAPVGLQGGDRHARHRLGDTAGLADSEARRAAGLRRHGCEPAWQRRRGHVKGRRADQLQAALARRALIEQAKGVLMQREHLDPAIPRPRSSGCRRWPGPQAARWPTLPATCSLTSRQFRAGRRQTRFPRGRSHTLEWPGPTWQLIGLPSRVTLRASRRQANRGASVPLRGLGMRSGWVFTSGLAMPIHAPAQQRQAGCGQQPHPKGDGQAAAEDPHPALRPRRSAASRHAGQLAAVPGPKGAVVTGRRPAAPPAARGQSAARSRRPVAAACWPGRSCHVPRPAEQPAPRPRQPPAPRP